MTTHEPPQDADHDADAPIWYQAIFWCQGDAERACAALWGCGAQGVEVRDAQTYFEGAFDHRQDQPLTQLLAYFELASPDQSPETLALELDQIARELSLRLESWGPYLDESWKTAWRVYFHPRSLSPRSVVGPPWEAFDAPAGGVKIIIEPAMAFGTGTHETTQLVARMIDERLARSMPANLLDVGTGSGILAFMAAKLGMSGPIVGVDHDAEAIKNAHENLALNGLDPAQLRLDTTPLGQIGAQFELVVANIMAHILIAISTELRACVAPGGQLILSGILGHQLQGVLEAYMTPQWRELERQSLGEWHAVILERALSAP